MPQTVRIGPEALKFLKQLRTNNNREWFLANKPRYEHDLREPLLRFIEAFEPRLLKISPHFVANPSKVGGSLFRIHRDTRFSRDKLMAGRPATRLWTTCKYSLPARSDGRGRKLSPPSSPTRSPDSGKDDRQ